MKNNNEHENNTHYLPLYMSIGISIGVAIGAALDNIGTGMCIGLGLGVCVGAALDAQNRKKNDAAEKEHEDTKTGLDEGEK